jgi:hypothetical integral membrane protein (TIGR02206 family)
MPPPSFHALNFQHIVTLAFITAACVLIAWRARTEKIRKWLGYSLGFILISYAAVSYVQQGMDHALHCEYSLPLELCNLVSIVCIVSLFRPNQFGTELAYYLGLGGVVQATVTPDLGNGFPSWDFILFFWGHGVTLIAIVFLITGRGFRPRPKSILRMMIVLNAYGLLVGILDAAAGWNYGYLCRKPLEPSLFDVLGPWPWYLLAVEGIAFLSFLLLDLPWKISGFIRKRGHAPTKSRERE